MKVKAKSLKNRTKTGISRQTERYTKPSSSARPTTMTSRIKRPDIVNSVAQSNAAAQSGRRDARSKRKTATHTRGNMYTPPGVTRTSSNSKIYWILGGVAGFVLMVSLIAIIVSSSGNDRPQNRTVTTAPTSNTPKKRRTKFKNYGPGSWADDPAKRAAIESSTLYKNRQSMKKNYKKDR